MDKKELLNTLKEASKKAVVTIIVAVAAKQLQKTDLGDQQIVLFTARK
jgi:hypothetical protein